MISQQPKSIFGWINPQNQLMPRKLVINILEGNGNAMNRQEDDESYEIEKNTPPRRSQRTKLKHLEDYEEVTEFRDKRSGKRSHRPKTGKNDVWPDTKD
jgi:predicted methyltransferase